MDNKKNLSEYNLWLHQLNNLYFNMIKIIFIYPLAIGILLKVLVSIFGDSNLFECTIEFHMALFTMITVFFAIYSERHSDFLKTYALLMLFEFSNFQILVLYVFGGRYNDKILIVTTSFITFFLEFLLIEISSWKVLAIQMKNILLWIYFDLLITGFLKPESLRNSVYLLISLILSLVVLAIVREKVLKVVFYYKQQIKKKQQNLETVLEYIPDGLMVLSMDMKVKLFNSSLKTLLHITNEYELNEVFELIRYSSFRRVYGPEDQTSLKSDVADYLSKSHTHLSGPVTFGVTEINDKYYEWRGNISIWNKKNSLILLARDITSLIHLEKSQAMQTCQTIMLRSFSHELRTPISAIISTNESLMMHTESKNTSEKLEIIASNSYLMLNIINNLLDYVQLHSGKFQLHRSHFNFRSAVEDIMKLFRIQTSHKNISMRCNIDPFIPLQVLNDSDRFRQVLINILINAIKFTQTGNIRVQALLKVDKIKVSIIDTGIGIPSSKLQSIFSLFESVDNCGETHGCGLKLHISKLIAERLGSESITVKSRVGYGSKFTFYLDHSIDIIQPLGSSESLHEKITPIHIPTFEVKKHPNEIRAKVLVVDDNEFNRLVIGEFLSQEGILYDEAINGEVAVKCVEEMNRWDNGYRVVVMDCQMPVMDGWKATAQIARMAENGIIKSCPVIIGYSAYCGSEEEKKSLDVGMKEFLVKPVPRNKFISVISNYLK